MSPLWSLLATLGLLGLNAFFVATEFALVASSSDRLSVVVEDGRRGSPAALAAVTDLPTHLAGAQFGMTMASLGIGFVAGPVAVQRGRDLALSAGLEGRWGSVVGLTLGLGVLVALHVVVGELVPRTLALAGPERSLLVLAGPSRGYLRVVRPVVRLLSAAAGAVVGLFLRGPRDASAHTSAELAAVLSDAAEEGVIEPFAHELLSGVLDLGGETAADVMSPRGSVVAVSRHATVDEVERVVVTSGHSRLVVTDSDDPGGLAGDLDRVLGFVHAKDLLSLPSEAHDRPLPLGAVRRLLVVPPDRALDDLLRSMRTSRVHLAVVVDPQRRTLGLVTLEDLLERLVGDILDESDRGAPDDGTPASR